MNDGQKKFLQFISERTIDGKLDDALLLLKESFSKQAAGEFNQEYMQAFMPRMLELIKPEAKEEVNQIMINFNKFPKER